MYTLYYTSSANPLSDAQIHCAGVKSKGERCCEVWICVHLLFPKLYFCFVNLVNAVKWRQGRGRGRREIMLIRPPWSMFAPSMVLPLETLHPGLWPKVKFHSKRALVTMDGWLYRVFQKNALWECCWSHSALAQSQVAGSPCVCKLIFWLFLSKTKPDQAFPSYVHGKI